MSFLPEHPNRRVITEFIDSLDSNTYQHMSDYFQDVHSKEVLKEFPLPSLPDEERIQLDEFLRAGTYEYK